MLCPTRTIQSPSKARRQPFVGCLNAFALQSHHQTTNLQMLSEDILLLIISFIEVRDILALRQTSKHFSSISKLRWVWLDAIKRHIRDRGLPVPAGDTDLWMVSAEQLEARAVHAAKFHDNWSSSNPAARHTLSFTADQYLPDEELDSHNATVNYVAFLPGCSGQFLVTVVGKVITCWEVPLGGSGAYRVAVHVSPHLVERLVVNEDKDSEATLAYLSGTSVPSDPALVVVLALDKFHGQFLEVSRLRSVRAMVHPLHAMCGTYLIVGHAPTIWYFRPPMEAVSLQSSFSSVQVGEIRAVKIINRYMVVVRENSLQLIYAPIWRGVRTAWGQQPGTLFKVKSAVMEAAIVHRNAVVEHGELADWPSTPVTVLLRCREDDVDMIVQLDLLPGPDKPTQPSVSERGALSRVLPFALCERVNAVPVPPSCQRLHAGPSGKGFCLQTRTMSSRHLSFPARCLVGFHVTPTSHNPSTASSYQANGEQSSVAKFGNDVHYSERPFYWRRCDMSEVMKRQYAVVSTAFEDTAGRIAVGDRHGQVEILDFA